MGLSSSNHEKKTYLQIVAGKFAQKVDEGTEGATTRFSEKANRNMYELLHDTLEGTIKSLKIETKEFDGGKKSKQLDVTISDVGELYIVSLPIESKFFDSFCAKIKSADLSKVVKLSPYAFTSKKDGKKVSGMNIFQNDVKLEYYYSNEEPKGKPVLKEQVDEEMIALGEKLSEPVKTAEAPLPEGIDPLPF
jgi:hypothetical protein